jgi:16S rRNA (adenine1518-N6/adenine1519-N6)-dimethyltransferase
MPEQKTFHPKRSLSQNYLTDENISRNIVKAFNTDENDVVIEIGPGHGVLTKYLLERTINLTAIELDKNNYNILKEKYPSLVILNQDFLLTDLQSVLQKYSSVKDAKLCIIGNIPYNITSGILFKLVDNRHIIRGAQLMIQEEVALRITAKPNSKDYGILSVFLQIFSIPKLLFKVSANCFYPKPKVDSRIIKFDFNNEKENEILDAAFFRKFVRTAFGTRRKTLRNSLKNMNIDTNKLAIDFDFSRRAENLTPEEFIELSNEVFSILKAK